MFTYRVGCTLAVGGLLSVMLVASGCYGGLEETRPDDGRVASMGFNLVKDADWAGNSVKVCGKRRTPADSKYPCLDGWGEQVCACLDFPAVPGGNPGDVTTPAKLTNLCPSANIESKPEVPGPSAWDFWWVIYNGPGCTGTPMTDPNPTDAVVKNDYNFICYDRQDLPKKLHPNQSYGELLQPGKNVNDILCITRNASKEFNFEVCVEDPYNPKVLDCGCKKKGSECGCEYDLPTGCTFTPDCKVVVP